MPTRHQWQARYANGHKSRGLQGAMMIDTWKQNHMKAMVEPVRFEIPISGFLKAIQDYASLYEERFEGVIGNDGVLGDGLKDIIQGLRTLLNGDCGRIDCGTIDSKLCELAERNSIEID